MPGRPVVALCTCCGDPLLVSPNPGVHRQWLGKPCRERACPTCAGPCTGTYRIPASHAA